MWNPFRKNIVGIKSFSITRLKLIAINPRDLEGLVGIKSFSITRLKRKYLIQPADTPEFSWNQKFLDYEIETGDIGVLLWMVAFLLESKVSRLRD